MYDKFLLEVNNNKDSFLKPLGAGLSMLFPLLLAVLLNNLNIGTLGVMGSFSYLAFQNKTLSYNMKAIFIHGVAIIFSFTLTVINF